MIFDRYFSSEKKQAFETLQQKFFDLITQLKNDELPEANKASIRNQKDIVQDEIEATYYSKLHKYIQNMCNLYSETHKKLMKIFNAERTAERDSRLRRLIKFDFNILYQTCFEYLISKNFTEDFANIFILIRIFRDPTLETTCIFRMIHYRDSDFKKIKFFIESLQIQKDLGGYGQLYLDYPKEINTINDFYTKYEEIDFDGPGGAGCAGGSGAGAGGGSGGGGAGGSGAGGSGGGVGVAVAEEEV